MALYRCGMWGGGIDAGVVAVFNGFTVGYSWSRDPIYKINTDLCTDNGDDSITIKKSGD